MLNTASPFSHVPERKRFEPHVHASYLVTSATKLIVGQFASIRCVRCNSFGSCPGVYKGKLQVKTRTCFSAINAYTTAMQLHECANNGQSRTIGVRRS